MDKIIENIKHLLGSLDQEINSLQNFFKETEFELRKEIEALKNINDNLRK